MTFGNIHLYWLILLLPSIILLSIYRIKRTQKMQEVVVAAHIQRFMIADVESLPGKRRRRIVLLSITTLAFFFAALRPQWGFTWKDTQRRGVDIAVLLDVSQSMAAADTPPNRLDRAKREISDLLNDLKGDRIALISFAGAAFIETPLTLDYSAYRMFLDNLSMKDVPVQGTNIDAALRKGLEVLGIKKAFDMNAPEVAKRDRAIVLITDGEELDGDLKEAGKIAAENGVRVYVLGIGSSEGAPIPDDRGGYKRDRQGKIIITRLNTAVLDAIASQTTGMYVQSISSSDDTQALYLHGIKRVLSDSTLAFRNAKQWHEYFQVPLFLAWFIIQFGLWGQVGRRFVRQSHNVPILLLCVFPSIFLRPSFALADSEALGAQAKRAYEENNFEEAEKTFDLARQNDPNEPRFELGLGASYYRQNKFDDAAKAFLEAAQRATQKTDKASALYNAGNSFVQQENFSEAIKIYEESLRNNPNDQEAKDNLEYAKRMLEQQKKQQDEQQQSQKNSSSSSEQQQNQSKKGNAQEQSNTDSTDQKDSKSEQQQDEKSKPSESPSPNDQQKESQNSSPQDQSTPQNQSDKNSGENSASSSNNAKEQNPQTTPAEQPKDGSTPNQATPTPPPSLDTGGEEQRKQEQQGIQNRASPSPTVSEAGTPEANNPSEENPGENNVGNHTKNAVPDSKNLDMLLDSLEEKQGSRAKYRYGLGLEQLRTLERKLPEKDW